MSFVTKRARVFEDEECEFLPPRNEGKLKAYESCTDARAWSHFCSDKTEHLVEIIKKNNLRCTKFVPTDVIVNTLMQTKNGYITKLKNKIDQLESFLSYYEKLELTEEQKKNIEYNHETMKLAFKDIELAVSTTSENLNISELSDVTDSEWLNFQSARSKGESKIMKSVCCKDQSMQICASTCDVATYIFDERVDELQEVLIRKDAKLSAMKNCMAVMENDVCQPFCIYANMYTALEKIFGTLCQNDKYNTYITLLLYGKDTSQIDITGKILFKLKVLEKFAMALMTPCSREMKADTCSQVFHVETSLLLTPRESKKEVINNDRSLLVADIMEHEEIKTILSKETSVNGDPNVDAEKLSINIDNYNLDIENLNRLKNLQGNYDELMVCYEDLKHQKHCLEIRCRNYEELEEGLESMRNKLREYSMLWNEKEHYRVRSEETDILKEQILVLSEENANLGTQLKAETEISFIKSGTIEELRHNNIALETKINDCLIMFEKEKNALQCKLKETECTIMCQEQQIKTLTEQIERLANQREPEQAHISQSFLLLDEVDKLKEDLRNLNEAILLNDEEKQQVKIKFEESLKVNNELRMDIEHWKSTCEKTVQQLQYHENYIDDFEKCKEDNKTLALQIKDKCREYDELSNLVSLQTQELISKTEELELKKDENQGLDKKIEFLRENYSDELAFNSLQIAQKESKHLLEKVNSFTGAAHNLACIEVSLVEYEELKTKLSERIEENKTLKNNLSVSEERYAIIKQENEELQNNYECVENKLKILIDTKTRYENAYYETKKDSENLKQKFEQLQVELQDLLNTQEHLLKTKANLEAELKIKSTELNKSSDILLSKVQNSDVLKESFEDLTGKYETLKQQNQDLQRECYNENLKYSSDLQQRNEQLQVTEKELDMIKLQLLELTKAYDALKIEIENKRAENKNLSNNLESKIDENRALIQQLRTLKSRKYETESNIAALTKELLNTQATLKSLKFKNEELLVQFENNKDLVNELDELNNAFAKIQSEKKKMQQDLDAQEQALMKSRQQTDELKSYNQKLSENNEELEKALIGTHSEFLNFASNKDPYSTIIEEMERLQRENKDNEMKIVNLTEELENAQFIVLDLKQNLSMRDQKIGILENQINSLGDEVKLLQSNLAEAVSVGEEISSNHNIQIDRTLEQMKAHHSKATHNMKKEFAEIQEKNNKLEQQLSYTKLKGEDSIRNLEQYSKQISQLQSEREIIVTDIKDMEIKGYGDSALTYNCKLEEILYSLDRIKKAVEAKQHKVMHLEQTINKVRNSSQLLLSKADEAIIIAEKERLKILSEKEQAIIQKSNLEKQLLNLKSKLEIETRERQDKIKDLKAEIMNQKLIADNFKNSSQAYKLKLEEELHDFKKLYENALEEIRKLKDNMINASDNNQRNFELIEKITLDLESKTKEVATLQEKLEDLMKKNKESLSKHSISGQTDSLNFNGLPNENNTELPKENNKESAKENNKEVMLNQVQILTASIEPTFKSIGHMTIRNEPLDSLRNKMKNLSIEKLEQYSTYAEIESPIIESLARSRKREADNKITKLMQAKNRYLSIENVLAGRTNSNFQYLQTTNLDDAKIDKSADSMFIVFSSSEGSSSNKTDSSDSKSSEPRKTIKEEDKAENSHFKDANTNRLLSNIGDEHVIKKQNKKNNCDSLYEKDPENYKGVQKSQSADEIRSVSSIMITTNTMNSKLITLEDIPYKKIYNEKRTPFKNDTKYLVDQTVINVDNYEDKIKKLTNALKLAEKDYERKLSTIKIQYDRHIQNMINKHDEGVKNIQGLHEETLRDLKRIHDNEVENLRTMCLDSMRKFEKMETDDKNFKPEKQQPYEEEITSIQNEIREHECKCRVERLSKTRIEAYNVTPKRSSLCTCTVDVNVSDTIHNIFSLVDEEHKKVKEQAFVKYIGGKLLNGEIEKLDASELAFLHFRVCRLWKIKLAKEEALQKKINHLEGELINKQRHSKQQLVDLESKLTAERLRLGEVREAILNYTPSGGVNLVAIPEVSLPPSAANRPTSNQIHGICIDCNNGQAELRPAIGMVTGPPNVKPRRLKSADACKSNEVPTRLRRRTPEHDLSIEAQKVIKRPIHRLRHLNINSKT